VAGDELALTVLRQLTATTPSRCWRPRGWSCRCRLAVLRLRGLEAEEARELIQALDGPEDAPTQAALVERTAGSPMLLRLALGLLRADPDAGLVEPVLSAAELGSSLMQSTLGTLSRRRRRLLGTARRHGAPGRPARRPARGTGQAAGLHDALRAQGELQSSQLLDHPGSAVLHPLVREHVRRELAADPELRRRLHHVAALHLERDPSATYEAAQHFADAGEPARPRRCWWPAGPRSSSGAARDAAADLAGRLARQGAGQRPDDGPNPLVAQLLTVRGDLLVGTLRAAEAEAAYRDALAETDGPVARAEVQLAVGALLIQRGGPTEALRLCRDRRGRPSRTGGPAACRPGRR
jgi:hypothetical protein